MKKLFTFLFSLLAIASATAQIPGGNFENWDALYFDYPASSNFCTYTSDQLSAETHDLLQKTTDASDGDYALKFATFGTYDFGYVLYGQMGNEHPNGGIPFADDPTQLTLSYKCNMAVNDSAEILVWLYSNGNQITSDIFKVGGVQNTYKDTTFNLSPYTEVIDSLLFGLVSTDPFVEEIRTDGNVVYFDNIRFNGSNNVQIPDPSFENWTRKTKEFTSQMYNISADVEKSTDAYKGDYALKMTTHRVDWNESEQQVQMDAQLSLWGSLEWTYNSADDRYDANITGGLPVDEREDTLVFYYKYQPPTNVLDTASVNLHFSENGSEVYSVSMILLPSNSYQELIMPFNLNQGWNGSVNPDHMVLSLESSKWRNQWNPSDVDIEGSSLSIDYMYFKSDLFTQKASFGENGTVTPEQENVIKGNSVTFTITPDAGYEINTATYNAIDVKGDLIADGDSFMFTHNVTGNGTLVVDFSLISGTEDLDQNGSIRFYPNPTSGVLNIQGLKENSLVEILTLTGKTIYQNRVINNTPIDISSIPDGVYFIRVENNLLEKLVKF